jgi:hypothetical protein
MMRQAKEAPFMRRVMKIKPVNTRDLFDYGLILTLVGLIALSAAVLLGPSVSDQIRSLQSFM